MIGAKNKHLTSNIALILGIANIAHQNIASQNIAYQNKAFAIFHSFLRRF